jgi:anti-sigma B factor antagonist
MLEPANTSTSRFATAEVTIIEGPTLSVTISGEIDHANTGDIERDVVRRCAEGLDAVLVDLSRTTYLDSAGLELLVRLARRLRTRRTPMTVVAPVGSAAYRVITLTGLIDELGAVQQLPTAT